MALPLIAAVAGISALGKGISGLLQKSAANRIAKENPFPMAYVQPEYQQNVAQAQQQAQIGMPQQQYDNQFNAIQRNQAGALNMLSRSANPAAGLASLIRGGNDANNQLNSQDAQSRQRNLLNLMQQRQILAGQKQGVWDWNNKQKYLTGLEKEQALRGAGNQNLMGAFNDATNLAGQLALMDNGGGDPSQQSQFSQGGQSGLASMQVPSMFPNRMTGAANRFNQFGAQWGLPFQQ